MRAQSPTKVGKRCVLAAGCNTHGLRLQMTQERFVVRWRGFLGDRPPEDCYLLKTRRSRRLDLRPKTKATSFDTREEAVKFCKVFVRNGRFGGDWETLCGIEPLA
jgi:hypothetical protein